MNDEDWDSDDEFMDTVLSILNDEHPDEDSITDSNYYVGVYFYDQWENEIILANRVFTSTFFRYSGEDLMQYFSEYSGVDIHHDNNIHILQVHIVGSSVLDFTYTVVVKTFWIKWIQRAFKRRFAEKRRAQRSIRHLLDRQRVGVIHYPSLLRGLLVAK
jgi:hypothetical protein